MSVSAGVSGGLRRRVMARDRYTCGSCGLQGREVRSERGDYSYPTARAGISLTIDHIVPRSRGGRSDDPANLRVLCTSCNSRKGARVVAPGSRG